MSKPLLIEKISFHPNPLINREAEPAPPVDNVVQLAEAAIFLNGEFFREGDALVIVSPAGERVVIADYFAMNPSPVLMAGNGAFLMPETVALLLRTELPPVWVAGPTMVPDQLVQPNSGLPHAATPPETTGVSSSGIGHVKDLRNTVVARSPGGVSRLLKAGDPIFTGEEIRTMEGGHLQIVFVDGTRFQLGESARMVMETYLYDPAAAQGEFGATVMKGAFGYASGRLALQHSGRHTLLKTPNAHIGVRGSELRGEVTEEGQTIVIHTAGILDISDIYGRGTVTLLQPGTATVVTLDGTPEPVFHAPEQILKRFNTILPPILPAHQTDTHRDKQEVAKESAASDPSPPETGSTVATGAHASTPTPTLPPDLETDDSSIRLHALDQAEHGTTFDSLLLRAFQANAATAASWLAVLNAAAPMTVVGIDTDHMNATQWGEFGADLVEIRAALPPPPPVVQLSYGVFLDSAVSGLRYQTASLSGITDSTGRFAYRPGETVRFYIGDILLGQMDMGQSSGSGIVTPTLLAATAVGNDPSLSTKQTLIVNNLLRLLQTLDSDDNPDNGIVISDVAQEQAVGATAGQIDITSSSLSTDVSLLSFIQAAKGTTTLVSETAALEHYSRTLETIALLEQTVNTQSASFFFATEDQPFVFTLSPDTFQDTTGAGLRYTVGALPEWLSFQADSLTFSGTPDDEDVGTVQVALTASGSAGSQVVNYLLMVGNTNDAPVAPASVLQAVRLDATHGIHLSVAAFVDPDTDSGDTLRYTATMADGTWLPDWLQFDAETRTLTNTPLAADADRTGRYVVKVTATDESNETASGALVLIVNNTAPERVADLPLPDKTAHEGERFQWSIPESSFHDRDGWDTTLSYAVSGPNGAALPDWLHFDAASRTLQGSPDHDDRGTFLLTVTATDQAGAYVADSLVLRVTNLNMIPEVGTALLPQSMMVGEDLSLTFPASAFLDGDGDDLHYTVTVNGTALADAQLPFALQFDSDTRTLASPAITTAGQYTIQVTADDRVGGQVASSFVLTVDTPPALGRDIWETKVPFRALEDQPFLFAIPSTAFHDGDDWDRLTYSVQNRPAWLQFDGDHTLYGTPGNGDVSTTALTVTATDQTGASIAALLSLQVVDVNDAPTLNHPLADVRWTAKRLMSLTLPEDTFQDIDDGTLRYTVATQEGEALPDWLYFDEDTHTFSGVAPTAGELAIRVTVQDKEGEVVSDIFTLALDPLSTNTTPYQTMALPDQWAVEDVPFQFQWAPHTFQEADVDDRLRYEVRQLDGSPLPAWLHFDGATHTLTGIPTNVEVGEQNALNIKVVATDLAGAEVADWFTLTVENTNDAPLLVDPLVSQIAFVGKRFVLDATDTFQEVDVGDHLTYRATLQDGSALPSWLHLTADLDGRLLFHGTPTVADAGGSGGAVLLGVELVAQDESGATATDRFLLYVTENHAPVRATGVGTQRALEDALFLYEVPDDIFSDANAPQGDRLSWSVQSFSSAQAAARQPLPTWLHFDADTHTLSGTPHNGDVGATWLQVTATDYYGASVQSNFFRLVVDNVNDAPVLTAPIDDQEILNNAAFYLTLTTPPAFVDVDRDPLILMDRYTQADGTTSRPSWLHFDAQTGEFTGMPGRQDLGRFTVTAIASDGRATATDSFDIEVRPFNHAPILAAGKALPDQQAQQNHTFILKLDKGTFYDPDEGDLLSWNAHAIGQTVTSGTASLPAWLTFDRASQTFIGTPGNADVGTFTLEVQTSDRAGEVISDRFNLTVLNENDRPILVAGREIPDQSVIQGNAFHYVLDSAMFADPDIGVDPRAALTLTATTLDGIDLTRSDFWLHFDPVTATFSGTPTLEDGAKTLNIKVTAIDNGTGELSVSDLFKLSVVLPNHAPTFVGSFGEGITIPAAVQSRSFIYTLPPDLFQDVDLGDNLTLSTIGRPSWLRFDPATQTFSGTPTDDHVGAVSFTIRATDKQGAFVDAPINLVVDNLNDAPILVSPIADQSLEIGDHFQLSLSPLFRDLDLDQGDRLTYSAFVQGNNLSDSNTRIWLHLDQTTGVLSGTVADQDLVVKVVATDLAGAKVYDTFHVAVVAPNHAPTVHVGLLDQTATEDQTFTFRVPTATFQDVDGDTLHLSATLADGSALPGWLIFDASTATFVGRPDNNAVTDRPGREALEIRVTASDRLAQAAHLLRVSETFQLTVVNTNDAPSLQAGVTFVGQRAAQGSLFQLAIPNNRFTDMDGDTLYYRATLADGSALPDWLTFDPVMGKLTGLPTEDNSALGTLNVRITASDRVLSDASGLTVSDTITIDVVPSNTAPTLAHPLVDGLVVEENPFSYQIPLTTFQDVDIGDRLTFSATLLDGTDLSSPDALGWVSFDPISRTLSGTPINRLVDGVVRDNVGTVTIRVTATDSQGESVSDVLDLTVINTNDAPVLVVPIAGQHAEPLTAIRGAWFQWQLAAGTFLDPDAGDSLQLSATMPDWLTFDAATRTFSGRPGAESTGAVVRLTATDTVGAQVQESFTIQVEDSAHPTLTRFETVVQTGNEAQSVRISLADLLAQADAADTDGVVSGFVVKQVTDGALWIGVDAGEAEPWAAGSNDTIDAERFAYWTGPQDGNGLLHPFSVVAQDNTGMLSSTPVMVPVELAAINDAPELSHFHSVIATVIRQAQITVTLADLLLHSDAVDRDGTVTQAVITGIEAGTLLIGGSIETAQPWQSGINDTLDAGNNAFWRGPEEATGIMTAFTVKVRDDAGADSQRAVPVSVEVTASTPPQLSPFATPVATADEDRQATIAWTNLLAQGNATDGDGEIIGFVIQSVQTGTVLLGPTVEQATPWVAGSNDRVDATQSAYWSGSPHAHGLLSAFTVAALDETGELSRQSASVQVELTSVNDQPTLTHFMTAVASVAEDQEVMITLADLLARSDAADLDGTIVGFVVKDVASGALLIGTDAQSATPWEVGSHDRVDATHHAYWTGAPHAHGLLDAFVVEAVDNEGGASVAPILVQIAVSSVNDLPLLSDFSAPVAMGWEEGSVTIGLAELLAQGNAVDLDGRVEGFVVRSVDSGVLWIGSQADLATPWVAGSHDRVDATHHAYWTGTANSHGLFNAFTVMALDETGAVSLDARPVPVELTSVNDAPVIQQPLTDQRITVTTPLSLTLPATTFFDEESAILTLTATAMDGALLPDWLHFDAATRTFSGIPTETDLGRVEIWVTARDAGGLAVADTFVMDVVPTNTAPYLNVAGAMEDRTLIEGASFAFSVDAHTFLDADAGDRLFYRATLADGMALPGWLRFDPDTQTFSGMPMLAAIGEMAVRVTATDMMGLAVQDTFTLTILSHDDNTPRTAGSLSVDQPIHATIADPGDSDWSAVTLAADTLYTFEMQGAGSGHGTLTDPYLFLRDSSGNLLTSNDDLWGSDTKNAQIVFQPTVGGTYYLDAQGFETATGSYTLTMRVGGDVDNTPETARSLTVDHTGNGLSGSIGAIAYAGDEDWVKVSLQAGKLYLLQMSSDGNGSTLDPLLILRDDQGTLLERDDDSGVGLDARIVFTPTVDGTYYLDARGSGVGLYSLSVQAVEADHDDTPETATPLAMNSQTTGYITIPHDTDWSAVTLEVGKSYTFDLKRDMTHGDDFLQDPYLYLRNSAGERIAGNDNYNGGYNARIVYTPTESGTYYLDARSAGSGTGWYQLSVTDIPDDNTPATAHTLAMNSSTQGDIAMIGDSNWSQVVLEAGQAYIFDMQGFSGGRGSLFDPLLRVRDSAGNTVVLDDNGGSGWDAQIVYMPKVSGVYYLDAQGSHPFTGSYTLSARERAWEADGDNTPATADKIYVDRLVHGTIATVGDSDWSAISLTAGTTYTFDLQGASSGHGTLADPYLRLRDGSGQVIGSNDDFSGKDARIVYTPTESGTYYLDAQGFGSNTGTYALSVSQEDDNSTPATAVAFPETGTIQGTIILPGDSDWMVVSLQAGATYTWEMLGSSSGRGTLQDSHLGLRDSSGALLMVDDDSGQELDARIRFTPTVSGTYYIDAQGSASSTGSYTLTMKTDYGSTPDSAGMLVMDSRVKSELEPFNVLENHSDNSDWWAVALTAGEAYSFHLEGNEGKVETLDQPLLQFRDASGELIGWGIDDEVLFRSSNQLLFRPSETATYYLDVQSLSGLNGSYALTAAIEYGHTIDTVASIPVNGVVGGVILGGTDSDWRAVVLTTGNEYTFDMQGTSSKQGSLLDPSLILRDATGNAVVANDDYAGLGRDARIVYQPTVSGTYYLDARSSASATGSYLLRVAERPVDTDHTAATAASLAIGDSMTGMIASAEDSDWAEISLVAGRHYRFDLQGAATGQGTLADPYLVLRDSAGGLLDANDDAVGLGTDARLFYAPTESGLYYLDVQGYGAAQGTYLLSADEVPVTAPPVTVLTGIFLDSPVAGLEYDTATQSGVTEAGGTFHYLEGETVSFHLGNIVLGQAVGQARLTPLDLAVQTLAGSPDGAISGDAVMSGMTNILRLLQTLDADHNPGNGIVITNTALAEAHSLAAIHALTESQTGFETLVAPYLTLVTGNGTMISPVSARNHFAMSTLFVPPATIHAIDISADTGSSDSDFVTRTAQQTVTATLSVPLGSSENLYGSINGGASWANITSKVTDTDIVWDGVRLSGSSDIQFKVVNTLNKSGSIASQPYTVDTVAPTNRLSSGLRLASDTGSSATDFLTNAASQTITGTLSAPLADGETLYGSVDDGATWTVIRKVVGSDFSWEGATLSGSSNLKFKVMDTAGNSGTIVYRPYVLDTVAPTTTIRGIDISADTGSSAADFITRTAAQTITGTLSASLAAGEILYGSIDGGVSWSKLNVSGTRISWSGVTLADSRSIQFKTVDAAGNEGVLAVQPYTVDTTAPVTTLHGIDISADTGILDTDFVTRTASQTITATLSSGLATGETLYGSLDNGATWTNMTGTLQGTALVWNGVTLTDGNRVVQFKVLDAAGNAGEIISQAYRLDTLAPTTTISRMDLQSRGTEGWQMTARLSAALSADEMLYGSVDGGLTWSDISDRVAGTSIAWTMTNLSADSVILMKMVDMAGNEGRHFARPTTTVHGIDITADSGSMTDDFLTNTANQTITATLSAPLVAGEMLYGSLDGGSNWVDVTDQLHGVALTWVGATLVGQNAIAIKVVNTAGNEGVVAVQAYTLDVTAPTTTASDMDISEDTGSYTDDFVTQVAGQTITATLDAALAEGERLYGSVDGGSQWTDITDRVDGTALLWRGVTLLSGQRAIQFKVTDAAGNDARITGQSYILDSAAPIATLGQIGLTSDTGISSTDFITRTANQTITGILSAPLAVANPWHGSAAEMLLGSVDGGATWRDISSKVDGTLLIWNDVQLAGNSSIQVKVVDRAGNEGTVTQRGYTLDTTAPATRVGGIDISLDSGASDSDFMTNTAEQTITGTLTVPLMSGERLYGSIDAGSNWVDMTNKVSGTSLSWTGAVLATGSSSIRFKAVDAAGNEGSVVSQPYTLASAVATTIGNIRILSDTGSSASDFLTKTTAQTITGTLSAQLASGEQLYGSLNGGATWSNISSKVNGLAISWDGATLVAGKNSIKFKVADAFGNTGAIATQNYELDTVGTTSISNLRISTDTGSSATDFVTNTAAQTITGTLSAALASGEILYGSVNSGASWVNITDKAAGTLISWRDATLTGSHSIQMRVTDAAGNDGPVATQSYTLDANAPVATVASMALSADTAAHGAQNSDFNTRIAAQTISGTLTSSLAAGEELQVSLNDGGSWSAATVNGTAWSLGQTFTSSHHFIQVRVVDAAGNVGPVFRQAYYWDQTAPDKSISSIGISNDTGISAGDFVTNASTQTITARLNVGLDYNNEKLYGSVDGGVSWTDITGHVNNTTISWANVSLLNGTNSIVLKVADIAGNEIVASQGYTLDTGNPFVAYYQSTIAPSSNVVLTFNEPVVVSGYLYLTDPYWFYYSSYYIGESIPVNSADPWQVTFSGSTMTINPSRDLHVYKETTSYYGKTYNYSGNYYVELPFSSSISDVAGNYVYANYIWGYYSPVSRYIAYISICSGDPLVLDLNGDGIHLTAKEAGTRFDMNGDAILDQVGWTGADDGLLVWDLNNDGQISDIREVISDQFVPGVSSSLSALATLDGNHDGKVDAQDEAFAHLQVWVDADQNGIATAQELYTLSELGISALGLTVDRSQPTTMNGNQITGLAVIDYVDGHQGEMVEVQFDVDVAGGDPTSQAAHPGILLTGSTASESLTAGVGDDLLLGEGGADQLVGGDGDDVIVIPDTAFQSIDGGRGTDLLVLAGADQTLDLTADSAMVTSVEIIDLTGVGNNTLVLTEADLIALSESSNVLIVKGDAGDVVRGGTGWTDAGLADGYHLYAKGEAVLQLGSAITFCQGDPLVLDLNGDGIHLTSKEAGSRFDMNGDGTPDPVGWIGQADGLLVLDRNGDGRIDNLQEVISEQAMPNATSSLMALATLDDNHDQQIDRQDAAFLQLQVWVDAKQDGLSDSQELFSLTQLGITSLGLTIDQPGIQAMAGNTITGFATVTYADGHVGVMAEVQLDFDVHPSVHDQDAVLHSEQEPIPFLDTSHTLNVDELLVKAAVVDEEAAVVPRLNEAGVNLLFEILDFSNSEYQEAVGQVNGTFQLQQLLNTMLNGTTHATVSDVPALAKDVVSQPEERADYLCPINLNGDNLHTLFDSTWILKTDP